MISVKSCWHLWQSQHSNYCIDTIQRLSVSATRMSQTRKGRDLLVVDEIPPSQTSLISDFDAKLLGRLSGRLCWWPGITSLKHRWCPKSSTRTILGSFRQLPDHKSMSHQNYRILRQQDQNFGQSYAMSNHYLVQHLLMPLFHTMRGLATVRGSLSTSHNPCLASRSMANPRWHHNHFQLKLQSLSELD